MEEEWFPFPARRLEPLPQDVHHATWLLGWPLRNKPQPTEKEARAALTRILYAQAQAMYQHRDNVPSAFVVIWLLAGLFGGGSIAGAAPPRITFKSAGKRSQRSWDIATVMHALYEKSGKGGYEKAAEKAAEQLGLSVRHIKRAYAKHKNDLR
jgi:hypothetical protein